MAGRVLLHGRGFRDAYHWRRFHTRLEVKLLVLRWVRCLTLQTSLTGFIIRGHTVLTGILVVEACLRGEPSGSEEGLFPGLQTH